MRDKLWLLGETPLERTTRLLRDVVYADQGSPEQGRAIEEAWRFLNQQTTALVKVERYEQSH